MSDDIKESELLDVNELPAEAKERLDYLEKNYKKAIIDRDRWKEKKRSDVEQSIIDRMESYRTKYETTLTEAEQLRADAAYKEKYLKEVDTVKKEAEDSKKKLQEYLDAQRKEILDNLPEGETREIGEKLDLMDLRKYAEMYKKQETKKHNSTSVGGKKGEERPKTLAEWKKLNS